MQLLVVDEADRLCSDEFQSDMAALSKYLVQHPVCVTAVYVSMPTVVKSFEAFIILEIHFTYLFAPGTFLNDRKKMVQYFFIRGMIFVNTHGTRRCGCCSVRLGAKAWTVKLRDLWAPF